MQNSNTNFEEFNPVTKNKPPMATITNACQIYFNSAAFELINPRTNLYVTLFWDSKNLTIGIKVTDTPVYGISKFYFEKNRKNSCILAARKFLRQYNLFHTRSVQYVITQQQDMFCIKINKDKLI